MGESDLPTYPEFKRNGYHWMTSAKLPAWSGYQTRFSTSPTTSSDGRSDGTVEIMFAPEGRELGEQPLTPQEIKLVQWVIDN